MSKRTSSKSEKFSSDDFALKVSSQEPPRPIGKQGATAGGRGPKPGKPFGPRSGSRVDVLCRMEAGCVVYFERVGGDRVVANFQQQIVCDITREVPKHCGNKRKYVTGLFTAVPSKIGGPIKYVVRVERVK